jgi:outer membrane protein assembly factor BamB
MKKGTILLVCGGLLTLLARAQEPSGTKLTPPLKLNWTYEAGALIVNQHFTSDACILNTVKGLTAVSLENGNLMWSYEFPSGKGIHSVVTLSDKYGAFVSYDYDDESEKGTSTLTVVDLATGKQKWSSSSNDVWHRTPVLCVHDRIYVVAGTPDSWEERINYFDMQMDEARLLCFSAEDGKVVWSTDLQSEDSRLVNADNLYVFLTDDFDVSNTGRPKNRLKCYSTSNGKQMWDYNPSGMVNKVFIDDVVVRGNRVLTVPRKKSELGEVACLDAASGDELWSRSVVQFQDLFTGSDHVDVSSSAWMEFRMADGDKVFSKQLASYSFWGRLGEQFGRLLAAFPGVNLVALPGTIASMFSGDGRIEIAAIPTKFLFGGLRRGTLATDQGLYALNVDENEVTFVVMNKNPEDDSKSEFILSGVETNAFLANTFSETHGFVTSNGQLLALKLADGTVAWKHQSVATNEAMSLGLIVKGDTLYLFTLNQLMAFTSG